MTFKCRILCHSLHWLPRVQYPIPVTLRRSLLIDVRAIIPRIIKRGKTAPRPGLASNSPHLSQVSLSTPPAVERCTCCAVALGLTRIIVVDKLHLIPLYPRYRQLQTPLGFLPCPLFRDSQIFRFVAPLSISLCPILLQYNITRTTTLLYRHQRG